MPHDDLDPGRLRLLHEVSLRGSIAGAARAVGLTPSAVSQQLAALEREARTPLLDRTSRGVALTGAGHALSARAEAIGDLLVQARADLDRLAGDVAGPLTLVTIASAAATLVSDAALDLARAHPDLELTVLTEEPSRGLAMLLSDDADLALVDAYDLVPTSLPESVVGRDLLTEPLLAVLPSSHQAPEAVDLADLADADWVMPPETAACGNAVRSACRTAGFEPRVRWETDDLLLLARYVAAGHGVAVLPRLAVAVDVARVQTRPLQHPLTRRLTAVTRASSAGRPVVQTVLSALAAAVPR